MLEMLLFIVIFILAGSFLYYQWQIQKICHWLSFYREHRTNGRFHQRLLFGGLQKLQNELNELLDEQVRNENRLQKNEKTLKTTITSLSHDIRTPLTSLDGYFQLLMKTSEEETRQRYAGIITGRIQSLKNVLEELFMYTRLQEESYTLLKEKVNYSACVFDTLISFYELFKQREIEPQIDLTDEKLFIYANEAAVSRSIMNIIKNALDHGKSRIAIALKKQGDCAVFICQNDICDNEKINLSKVFDRFYMADEARKGESTGLGLSITKELVERSGGTIRAEQIDQQFQIVVSFVVLADN